MQIKHNRKLTERAQELRRNATSEENHLWYDFLSKYPVRFRRQVTFDKFIVDFYCHKAKLAIELDGNQHLNPDKVEYDQERTCVLNKMGISVLRIPNCDININFADVCQLIDNTVSEKMQKS